MHSQNVLEVDAFIGSDCPLWHIIEIEDDKFLTSSWQIYDNLSDYVDGITLYSLGEQLTMPNFSQACHFDKCEKGLIFSVCSTETVLAPRESMCRVQRAPEAFKGNAEPK